MIFSKAYRLFNGDTVLLDKIKLGYPNIWIKNSDPFRIQDVVLSTVSRDFYTIDFSTGFSKYIDNSWKSILVENPAYELTGGEKYVVTFDNQIALNYLLNEVKTPSTYIFNIIGKPDSFVQNISGFLSHFKSSYRTAFWQDDLSKMPLQFIFISTQDCPEDYLPYFNVIEDSFPSKEELYTIVSHINTSAHDSLVHQNEIKDVVNAGLGLTESQFIDLCLTSVLSTSSINSKFIYDQKMSSIKKNGILEIIKPKISFDDIGGLDNIKDIIRRTATLWSNKDKAQSYGITPIRRLLMVGIPGTGKSAICQATAAELGLDLARTGISQVMNSFIGQSEANMRAVFNQIKLMSPLCVWIDEFGRDLSGGGSSSHVDGGTTDRVHGEFLTGLQELPEETFLMCAANQLDALRPEMLRADRFDKIVFVGLPAHEERRHIFNIHLSQIDTDHTFNLDALADATKYFTGAEIVAAIRETKFYVTSESFRPITTQDLLTYIPKNKNIIWLKHNQMVMDMYAYAVEQWDWASTDQYEDARILLGKSSSVQPVQKQSTSIAWK
jgi:ATP-dependent 26S proteasome regulatory subunit